MFLVFILSKLHHFSFAAIVLTVFFLLPSCKNAPHTPADRVIDNYELIVEKWEQKSKSETLFPQDLISVEMDQEQVENILEQYFPLNEEQTERTTLLTGRLKVVKQNLRRN